MTSKHQPLPPLVHESAMDYHQHEKTYSAFVTWVKVGILVTAVSVIILYFLIRP